MATYGGESSSYVCSECGCTTYETGQIRVSGGFWSSFFDVGNKRTTLSPVLGVASRSSMRELLLESNRCLISLGATKP